MKAQNDNAGKLANQIKKALRLVSAIDAAILADGADPYRGAESLMLALSVADAGSWATMAVGQGETPPSPETKALVLDVYAARVRALQLAKALAPAARVTQSGKRRHALTLHMGG